MKQKTKEDLYNMWLKAGGIGITNFWCDISRSDNTLGVRFKDVEKAVKAFKQGWKPPVEIKEQGDTITEVCICDLHIPYHDPHVVGLVIDFIKEIKPDRIKILGDLVDFYGISLFDKDPARESSIQKEIDQTKELFSYLSPTCDDIKWLEGNHERRLKRFKWKNACINSLDVLSMENLFECGHYGIEYISSDIHYPEFMFSHGRGVSEKELCHKFSGYTAKNLLDANGVSGVSGHTHRLGVHYRTKRDGARVWAELGCLCDTQPEYIKGKPDWQQGFGVVTFKGSKFSVSPISINKNDKGRPFFLYGSTLYD